MPNIARRNSEITQDVVLLGASNLVLGWQALTDVLRQMTMAPLNLNVALGMGRSYLKTSTFWFRKLPGIRDCGLWDQLPRDAANPPLVLITDLGNDIVYLFDPDQIAATVRQCINQILAWRSDAKIVITGLPLESLTKTPKLLFKLNKTILFPRCPLSRAEILERALALDHLMRQMAGELGIPLVDPESDWYGFDPIHVVPKFRGAAFQKYFAAFELANLAKNFSASAKVRIGLPRVAAQTIFGRNRIKQQPVFSSSEIVISAW